MKSSWFHGLDQQQQIDLKVSYLGGLVMRKRLATILADKIDGSAKTARSKLLYDNPNWAFLQADQRGYERAMQEIIEFILDADKEKE